MKPFTTFAMVLLGLISLVQLVRLLQAWEIVVNGFSIPLWASGVACVVSGVTAVMLWRESRP
jgi:hypothetical protein